MLQFISLYMENQKTHIQIHDLRFRIKLYEFFFFYDLMQLAKRRGDAIYDLMQNVCRPGKYEWLLFKLGHGSGRKEERRRGG